MRTAIVVPEWKEGEHRPNQRAWTAEGLRAAIEQAPAVLGRAGTTPRLIRGWRALLPAAEAYDARRAGVAAFFCTDELARAARETESAGYRASAVLSSMKATTRDGLAIKVRHLEGTPWRSMSECWATLLESAEAVSGVALSVPAFDVAAWAEAFEAAGGKIVWHAGPAEWEVSEPPFDSAIPSERRQTVKGLWHDYSDNRLAVRRWLAANREA